LIGKGLLALSNLLKLSGFYSLVKAGPKQFWLSEKRSFPPPERRGKLGEKHLEEKILDRHG
jgi:hypothetical protein